MGLRTVIAVTILGIGSAAAAQEPPRPAVPLSGAVAPAHLPANAPKAAHAPFDKVFLAQTAAARQQLAAARAAQRTATPARVVCGMLVLTPDPAIDPGIKRPVPDSGVEHTMRIVEPPICFAR